MRLQASRENAAVARQRAGSCDRPGRLLRLPGPERQNDRNNDTRDEADHDGILRQQAEPPEGEQRHLERLRRTKTERDQEAWRSAMERLEAASKEPGENTMPYVIEAVKAKATVGEVSNMWRRVFGEYKEHVVV